MQNVCLDPWVFLAMLLQFIVNIVVVMLVIREFCPEATEENPSDKAENERKNSREPPAVKLTTEEEQVTKLRK